MRSRALLALLAALAVGASREARPSPSASPAAC